MENKEIGSWEDLLPKCAVERALKETARHAEFLKTLEEEGLVQTMVFPNFSVLGWGLEIRTRPDEIASFDTGGICYHYYRLQKGGYDFIVCSPETGRRRKELPNPVMCLFARPTDISRWEAVVREEKERRQKKCV